MSDLAAQVEKLIDAAVEAEFSHYYFFPIGGGMYERTIDPAETFHVSDGRDYIESLSRGGLFQPAAVVEKFRNGLTDAFRYWHSLPEPSGFQPHIDDLCRTLLWINMTPTNDSHGDGPAGTGIIPTELGVAYEDLLALSGVTIDLFGSQYLRPLGDTLSLYHLSLEVAIKAICSEQEMWKQADLDIAKLADDALEAFQKSRLDTSSDITSLFEVIGTISGVMSSPTRSVPRSARSRG